MSRCILDIGFHRVYIRDYPGFRHLVDIPTEVALAWIKRLFGDKCSLMGSEILTGEMTLENIEDVWINKTWLIVANEHGKWIALNNSDGQFSIYVKPEGKEDYA